MSYIHEFLKAVTIMPELTQKEMDDTLELLRLYAPVVRHSLECMEEYSEECYESRRQSIADYINLAVDYNRDIACKKLVEHLLDTGHTMELLKIMESALIHLRDDPRQKKIYYKVIQARYFDCYCRSNEDAFLRLGIASSTYYRNIKPAQEAYGLMLWRVVIPHFIIAFRNKEKSSTFSTSLPNER